MSCGQSLGYQKCKRQSDRTVLEGVHSVPMPQSRPTVMGSNDFADHKTVHSLTLDANTHQFEPWDDNPGITTASHDSTGMTVIRGNHTLAATVSTSNSRASLMGRLTGRRIDLLSGSIELGLDSLLCKAELVLTPFRRSNTDFLPCVVSPCICTQAASD